MKFNDFNSKDLDLPIRNFSLYKTDITNKYIRSIPDGLYLISLHEHRKGKAIGQANSFSFYVTPYVYVSARFNINDSKIDYEIFLLKIETMFSTLHYLNNKPTRATDMYLILKHIRDNSRYVFNLKDLYKKARNFQYSPSLVEFKARDYSLLEKLDFERNIDYLNALNEARKIVNCEKNLINLFDLLEERISNNDYGYLNEAIINGHKNNNLLIYAIIQKFNLLCTGYQRQPRKKLSSEPLSYNNIKSLTLKCLSLNKQQQNACMQKGIVKYEKKIKELNRLVNNREIANQLFLILKEITNLDTHLVIISDDEVQKQLKKELMCIINKKESIDIFESVKEFDCIYKKKFNLPLMNNLSDIF